MKLVRRLTDPTGAQTQLTTNGRRTQNFTFSLMRHHITPVPGWAYPPVPVPPRPAGALPSSLRAGGLFFPNPTRVDATPWIAHAKVISMMIGTSSRRVWPKARFFSQLVTQGTAPHGGVCQYLPIESTTGPTLPDGSPRNSTHLTALNLTHLPPLAPRFLPEGLFLIVQLSGGPLTPTQWSPAALT